MKVKAEIMSVEMLIPTNDNPITPDRDEGGYTRVMISVDTVLKETEATKLTRTLLDLKERGVDITLDIDA